MGCLYFNVSEGVRWAKSSKKREDFPCPAGQATRLPCGERTCPEHVLQSEVDNLCPPLCQAGGRDGTEGEGRGGQKAALFWPRDAQGRPIRTEGFPTVNVAVSGEIANFFTRTDPICWGKNRCIL